MARIATAVLLCSTSALAQPVFYGLGDLPGGAFASRACAVSADGLTVVGSGLTEKGEEACLWRIGQDVISLGDLDGGSVNSIANSVSADGSVVVGRGQTEPGPAAFRWTAKDGLQALPAPEGFDKKTEATAVSSDGKVAVGTADDSTTTIPVRWTAKGVEVLSSPPDEDGALITGTSADGSVVVGYENMKPYVWRDGRPSLLEALPKTQGGFAIAISADGTVVVGYSYPENPTPAPTIWRSGNVDALPMRNPKDAASATAVCKDGTVIVGRDGQEAVIWTKANGEQSVSDLIEMKAEPKGWKLTGAVGVSANGKVVAGNGVNPDGKPEAWIVDLTGETLPRPKPESQK